MLESLHIKNLAIVDNIRVEFTPGLNVITGETGAGKSILAAALGLMLGERADRSLIRAGEERASIEAVFRLQQPQAVNRLLQEMGLDPCPDGELILRRTVTTAAGSRTLINDAAVTLNALKQLGDLLVDLHGPHDHQSLLHPDFQRDVLDAFGRMQEPLARYQEAYRNMTTLRQTVRQLEAADDDAEQQLDLLTFQIQEIEKAGLTDDDENLDEEHALAANAVQILEHCDAVATSLTDAEDSLCDRLVVVRRTLSELARLTPQAAPWVPEAESVLIQTRELADSVSRFAQSIDADPQRLQWLDDRLALLQKLKRKYGPEVADIRAAAEQARRRLASISGREEELKQARANLQQAEIHVQAAGREVTQGRRKAAGKMAKAITAGLRDLGFKHAAFEVTLAPLNEPAPHGLDRIEYGFAPNVGETMRPLRAIASSGEISRVMLAVKAVLADHDAVPVLVFDEIDANVGGETGTAVGRKLAMVAQARQVLCITHLPQVAVHGYSHFVVHKSVQNKRTLTSIRPVQDQDRVEEIARMLGGKHLTSVTLQHAGEMLKDPRL